MAVTSSQALRLSETINGFKSGADGRRLIGTARVHSFGSLSISLDK